MTTLDNTKRLLLRASYILLGPALSLLAILLLVTQFLEMTGRREILPLTSFIVLLSFSGLAFNWCRTSSTFSSEATLERVFRSAVELFIASLLALVSVALGFMKEGTIWIPAGLALPIFIVHWIFLALALLLFLLSIFTLLSLARPK